MAFILLGAGLALLLVGGELLVRGAVQFAAGLGVSPLIIGLTLVGFGTSTPELVTSVQAALSGSPGIAYGNVVGSNIANILLILGASALLTPILVTSEALKRDTVLMVGVALLFAAVAATAAMGRATGAIFLAILIGYIVLAVRQERSRAKEHGAIYDKTVAAQDADPALRPQPGMHRHKIRSLMIAVAGLAIVVVGGYLLVNGAVDLARTFGISETVIGLTIVAVGTSMPELVTSLMAAFRGQTDVAFGNIVGSNIYNTLGIGGTTAVLSGADVPQDIVAFDGIVMCAVSVLLLVLAYTSMRISRAEGGVLAAGYLGYVAWLWPA